MVDKTLDSLVGGSASSTTEISLTKSDPNDVIVIGDRLRLMQVQNLAPQGVVVAGVNEAVTNYVFPRRGDSYLNYGYQGYEGRVPEHYVKTKNGRMWRIIQRNNNQAHNDAAADWNITCVEIDTVAKTETDRGTVQILLNEVYAGLADGSNGVVEVFDNVLIYWQGYDRDNGNTSFRVYCHLIDCDGTGNVSFDTIGELTGGKLSAIYSPKFFRLNSDTVGHLLQYSTDTQEMRFYTAKLTGSPGSRVLSNFTNQLNIGGYVSNQNAHVVSRSMGEASGHSHILSDGNILISIPLNWAVSTSAAISSHSVVSYSGTGAWSEVSSISLSEQGTNFSNALRIGIDRFIHIYRSKSPYVGWEITVLNYDSGTTTLSEEAVTIVPIKTIDENGNIIDNNYGSSNFINHAKKVGDNLIIASTRGLFVIPMNWTTGIPTVTECIAAIPREWNTIEQSMNTIMFDSHFVYTAMVRFRDFPDKYWLEDDFIIATAGHLGIRNEPTKALIFTHMLYHKTLNPRISFAVATRDSGAGETEVFALPYDQTKVFAVVDDLDNINIGEGLSGDRDASHLKIGKNALSVRQEMNYHLLNWNHSGDDSEFPVVDGNPIITFSTTPSSTPLLEIDEELGGVLRMVIYPTHSTTTGALVDLVFEIDGGIVRHWDGSISVNDTNSDQRVSWDIPFEYSVKMWAFAAVGGDEMDLKYQVFVGMQLYTGVFK